jgi:SHS2 domain-containing protein
MENGFRILEHPADMGIEATGADLSEAFRQAAFGLVSIVVDPSTVQPSVQKEVSLDGSDAENLLVRWLSEILYLYDGEDFLVSDIEMANVSATKLKAKLHGEYVVEGRHRLRMDVKAITYHQVGVSRGPEGATVRVFLDI